MKNHQRASEILKVKGLRQTKARLLVLEQYLGAKRPLSILDLKKVKALAAWDESSLYRNISKLEESGIIRSIPSQGEFQSHELVPNETGHHHHHIICSQCGTITCLKSCGIQKRLQEMANEVGFTIDGHRLELFGLCSRCRD